MPAIVHAPCMRCSEMCNPDTFSASENARHAGIPKMLALGQSGQDELMNTVDVVQCLTRRTHWRCYHLQQGFGEIGRDRWMTESRAQLERMIGLRYGSILSHPERLFFQTHTSARHKAGVATVGQRCQSLLNLGIHGWQSCEQGARLYPSLRSCERPARV